MYKENKIYFSLVGERQYNQNNCKNQTSQEKDKGNRTTLTGKNYDVYYQSLAPKTLAENNYQSSFPKAFMKIPNTSVYK